jgi:hypothetical protein
VIKAPTREKAMKKMRRMQLRVFQSAQRDPDLRVDMADVDEHYWSIIGQEPVLSPWKTHGTRSGGYGC